MIEMIEPTFIVGQKCTQISIFHANAGQGLPKHDHTYSHLSFCNAGSVIIRKAGKELVMTKDTQPVNLVANEWHEIEALEDGTVFVNVFSDCETPGSP